MMDATRWYFLLKGAAEDSWPFAVLLGTRLGESLAKLLLGR